MAQVEGRAKLEASVVLVLTEDEAAALEAIFSYGADPFLAVFYEQMGEHYLRPHEAGLRSLVDSTRVLALILRRAGDARKVFYGERALGERLKPACE